MQPLDHIDIDPAIMGGRPRIRGTRVTVGTVLGLFAAGKREEDVLELYPYLTAEGVRAALAYAAWRVEETDVDLMRVS